MKDPVKDYKHRLYPLGDVSQWFGENPDLYAKFDMKGHNGIDIVRPWFESLYAVENGLIVSVKDDPDGYGRNFRLLSDDGNLWVYGHCAVNLVEVGQRVLAGDEVAKMGNTGFTTSSKNGLGFWIKGSNRYAGTHVHLGLRKVKISHRKKSGYWRYNSGTPYIKVENYDNGYKGSIDPFPYFKRDEVDDQKGSADITMIIRLIRVLQKLGIIEK